MGLLKKELNRKYRGAFGDYIVKNPTDEQWGYIKEQFSTCATMDNSLNVKGKVDEDLIRYMIREITNIGDEIDTINGDDLNYMIKNGSRDFKSVINELTDIIIEITEEFQRDQYNTINIIGSFANTIKSNLEFENVKNNMDKVLKKQGIDIAFEEFMELSQKDPVALENKLKMAKAKKSTKKVNKKK